MKTIISYLCLFFVCSSGYLSAQNSKVETLKNQLKRTPPQRTLTVPLQDEEAFRQKQQQEQNSGRPLWAPTVKLEFDFSSIPSQVDAETNEVYRLIALEVDPNQLATMSLYFDEFDLKGSDQFSIITNIEDNEAVFEKTLNAQNNQDKGQYSYGFVDVSSPIIYLKLIGRDAKVKITSIGYVFNVVGVNGWSGFNTSLACIRPENVNCPQYSHWCDESRSVFKMCMTANDGGLFICSGSLVTNERSDGSPLALTADHCIDNVNNAQTIYMFNYESPNCTNTNGPLNNTVCGSTLLANDNRSDYAILRLTDAIPKEYGVFYAGWTNDKFSGVNDNPTWGAGIHHPSGDIKKVMTFNDRLRKRYVIIGGDWRYVWRVNVNTGGTEGGSSGSPLYQGNKQLIGQLSGGQAGQECEKKYYGRFYRNWHNYGLSWILNPNGDHSGSYKHYISAMSGFDPCVPNYNFTSANNLHTSAGVTFLNYAGTAPRKHNGVYVTSGSIQASQNVQIQNNTFVEFDAGSRVLLRPGFHALGGSHFLAHIDGCEPECGRPEGSFKMAPPEEDDGIVIFDGPVEEQEEEPFHERDDGDYEEFENPLEDPVETPILSEEGEKKTNLFIYPNPAILEFAVELSNNSVRKLKIYSSKGILLEERVTSRDQLRYNFSTYNEKAFIVVKAISESDIIIKQVLIKP